VAKVLPIPEKISAWRPFARELVVILDFGQ